MIEVELRYHWDALLEHFAPKQRDTYFREEYVRLNERAGEKTAAFVCREEEKLFLLPILLRTFEFQEETLYDFETAYGYGGPISTCQEETFIKDAWNAVRQYCVSHGFVCGFVRFHPLLRNWIGFETIGALINDRHTVAINLIGDEDYIWKTEIHTKNRNVIKHGERDGLRFEADYEFKYLSEFKVLYESTMDKLSADGFYYFPATYYAHLKEACPDSFLGLVWLDDKIVAAAVFFYDEYYGHYHLAGSDKEYLRLSPNNFLLWNAAKELKMHNVVLFHLGGGTDGNEENSLFQFKRKFSKELWDFKFGKMIFNVIKYEELCANWMSRATDAQKSLYGRFLLKYKY